MKVINYNSTTIYNYCSFCFSATKRCSSSIKSINSIHVCRYVISIKRNCLMQLFTNMLPNISVTVHIEYNQLLAGKFCKKGSYIYGSKVLIRFVVELSVWTAGCQVTWSKA